MKIVYLTWGETPRSYGVFGSQVIGQFVETQKALQGAEFYFISGLPIIHSGLVREKWNYKKEISRIKEFLGNIPFVMLPIFAPQNFVNSSKITFKLMHLISNKLLKKKLFKIKPNVVHCRSYHAAYAALKVREQYNLNYKIVFDGRGLYPEEIALKKNYTKENESFIFLKEIEKELLAKCDVSVAVSDTMKQHYNNLEAKRTECVYLSSSTKKLRNDKIENSKIINFGYVGALSDDTWHKPKELLDLYAHLRIENNTKLTIVTTSNHELIRNYFSVFPNEEIYITSTKTTEELKEVLKTFDFGLMSYFVPQNGLEKTLACMVLAVKTVEYIAAGLPVIVNKYCGGAAAIIEKYNLGISYDPQTFKEVNYEAIYKFVNDSKQNERSNLAEKLFDYNVNAKKYSEIYKSLM